MKPLDVYVMANDVTQAQPNDRAQVRKMMRRTSQGWDMFLGIDANDGVVYESAGSTPNRPVYPTPVVSQARLICEPDDWQKLTASFLGNPHTWLFREDSFDAVTRTRRGRLYQHMSGASYPQHGTHVWPHFGEFPGGVATLDGKVQRSLHVFAAGTELLQRPDKGMGQKLAIGNANSASAWRIVQVELTVYDDVMLTLKALTAFGLIPEVDYEQVRAEFQADVRIAVERAVNSAFRETAESVVDQCRNALVVILSRWLIQRGASSDALSMDLGRLAKELATQSIFCSSWVASLVAKLHSRGKMNEQKSLRHVTDDDAELSVQLLGFVLRETGWAKP